MYGIWPAPFDKENDMATLREEITAKIAAAEADLAALKQHLATLETSTAGVLEQDAEAVRNWFKSLAHFVGL